MIAALAGTPAVQHLTAGRADASSPPSPRHPPHAGNPPPADPIQVDPGRVPGSPTASPPGPTILGAPHDGAATVIRADAGHALPPPVERLAYRFGDVVRATGLSRRTLERERAAGRFPPPDRVIGRMPIWRVSTIRRWLAGGGR